MGKNDFDFNFDATNDDDFDPTAFLGSEDFDENMDLSEFSDEDFDLTGAEEDLPLDDADGEYVLIESGLSEGDTVYYPYYEALDG